MSWTVSVCEEQEARLWPAGGDKALIIWDLDFKYLALLNISLVSRKSSEDFIKYVLTHYFYNKLI